MGFATAHRRFLLLSCAGLAATGLAWTWIDLRYGFGPVDEPSLQAARAWLARAHGALAMLGLAAFGSVAATHIRCNWSAGSRRVSGIALTAVSCVLAVSAYFLYYVSGDALRNASAWAHIVAGAAATVVFVLHWLAPNAGRGC